ncbi:MAG TPA: DUF3787 domain-containing protein [Desulfitobacteriaceae bacterium]|nr:DUF3787 domain-containing protein [Desulfitobacteriaceae bacterium]
MAENKTKEQFIEVPIERHETAAWRGHIVETKPLSKVAKPSEIEVDSAKKWVDSNEK